MTLKQILTFAEVAKHLNLTRASAALKVGQSCLTQQVRKLEVEYQTKLYQKTMRGISLTPGSAASRSSTPALANLLCSNVRFTKLELSECDRLRL
jgi:DNA-binding transcriptional LysR family regulator